MTVDLTHNITYVHARIALSEAEQKATLCYWIHDSSHEFHRDRLHEALREAAKHLGYVLVPVPKEDAKNILPVDEEAVD